MGGVTELPADFSPVSGGVSLETLDQCNRQLLKLAFSFQERLMDEVNFRQERQRLLKSVLDGDFPLIDVPADECLDGEPLISREAGATASETDLAEEERRLPFWARIIVLASVLATVVTWVYLMHL